MDTDEPTKPFNPYNIFGRLKKSADYNYLYAKELKKHLKATKKLEKKIKKDKNERVA